VKHAHHSKLRVLVRQTFVTSLWLPGRNISTLRVGSRWQHAVTHTRQKSRVVIESEVCDNQEQTDYDLQFPERASAMRTSAEDGRNHPNNTSTSALCDRNAGSIDSPVHFLQRRRDKTTSCESGRRQTSDRMSFWVHSEPSRGVEFGRTHGC